MSCKDRDIYLGELQKIAEESTLIVNMGRSPESFFLSKLGGVSGKLIPTTFPRVLVLTKLEVFYR